MATQRLRRGSDGDSAAGIPLFYQTANGSAIRDGHTVVSLSRQNGHSWRERQYAGRAGWLIEIETAHIKIKWLLLGLMNFPLARTLSHSNMATIYPLSLALSPTLAHAYAPAPAHGYVPLARTLDNDDDAAFLGFLAGRIDCCAQFKLNFHCERVCRSFTLALSLFRSPTGPLALCREKADKRWTKPNESKPKPNFCPSAVLFNQCAKTRRLVNAGRRLSEANK